MDPIGYDIDEISRESQWFAAQFAQAAGSDRLREVQRQAAIAPPFDDSGSRSRGESAGRDLESRFSAPSRARLKTLLYLEQSLLEEGAEGLDWGAASMVGCQITEEHLRAVLVPASIKQRDMLQRVLKGSGGYAAVGAWFSGRTPPTLGVLGALLEAHRLAARARVDLVLLESFDPRYRELLLGGGLESALREIRRSFRNAVMHATAPILTEDEYRSFADLAVGARSFQNWYSEGASRDLPAGRAVLHYHVELLRAPLAPAAT